MQLVRTRLIEYKIKMKSELVVMQDGKVVRIKPEDVIATKSALIFCISMSSLHTIYFPPHFYFS
ncbi:MAG: hypothetical protein IPJ13_11345 [Saprospiraceae bacterium]|nr:hypothetical protein [Saprospiraceae bacterium]